MVACSVKQHHSLPRMSAGIFYGTNTAHPTLILKTWIKQLKWSFGKVSRTVTSTNCSFKFILIL
ncbi:hypothetical protein TPENAI_30396 [Tenacibaculum litopenaei]